MLTVFKFNFNKTQAFYRSVSHFFLVLNNDDLDDNDFFQ